MHRQNIVQVDGEAYILGQPLSGGLIGVVYPAWKHEGGKETDVPLTQQTHRRPDRAVKVPAPGLNDSLMQRFWSEYEVLDRLTRAWKEKFSGNPSPFPLAKKGRLDGREVLVMEFVPEDWSLSAVLRTKTGLDREKLALKAAAHYARLLVALHTAGYVCLDRKFLDFFFDTQHERLIVLDWNVVEPHKDERVPEEHTMFAVLWYQFLSGKVPPAVFNPVDDESWGETSLGTRRLLSDVWWGWYVEKERELAEHIDAWQKYFDWKASELLKQAPTKDQIDKEQSVDDWWKGLALRDLARRVADVQERQKYEDAYKDFRSSFDERFDRLFSDADMALITGEYKQGLENLKKLDRVAEGDPEIALQRERWRVALSAGLKAREEGRDFFLLTRWLPDVLKMMRREEVEKCDTELRNRKNDLDEHPLLNVFTIETEILRRWNDYQEKQAEIRAGSAVTNKQYQDIVQIIRDIEGKLHKLKEKGGERYEQALRNALFPNLETLKKQAEERAHAEIALYPPEQGLDPLNYLRFRFRDVHNLDEGRIKHLRELLDFWTLITSLVEQTDTRRPIGEALLAGIVERQVNEVLPAWVTELVRQEKGDVRSALQTQVAALLEQEQVRVHETLQNHAAELLDQVKSEWLQAFQAKMNDLMRQTESQFRAALQDRVKSQLSQAESDVRHALQSRVNEFLSQEEDKVRQALKKQIYDYWLREGSDSVRRALQTQVDTLLPQEADRVRRALQTQVDQFLSQAESNVRRALQSQVSKFLSQKEDAVRQELQKQVDDLIFGGRRQIEDLLDQKKGEFRKDLQEWVDNLQREEQPERVGKLVRYEFYRLVVQQFAWLVERSTSQERMAIWADDLRFNTLCLALKELLEGKTRSDIPEELKQQLSVIKKSLPSTESKSYQSKSYQIDEKKFKEWRDFFDYWTPDNQ